MLRAINAKQHTRRLAKWTTIVAPANAIMWWWVHVAMDYCCKEECVDIPNTVIPPVGATWWRRTWWCPGRDITRLFPPWLKMLEWGRHVWLLWLDCAGVIALFLGASPRSKLRMCMWDNDLCVNYCFLSTVKDSRPPRLFATWSQEMYIPS